MRDYKFEGVFQDSILRRSALPQPSLANLLIEPAAHLVLQRNTVLNVISSVAKMLTHVEIKCNYINVNGSENLTTTATGH